MSDAFVVYVRHGEKVLIMQRADEVADFPGAWDGVYGIGNPDDIDTVTTRITECTGIPAESLLCYVQLGAGKINDIDSEIRLTLDAISTHPELYAVVGESMLGERIASEYRKVRILRDFPNSRYFADFDFAIMAGGYNSFHEAIQASLPTICFCTFKIRR